MPEESTEDVSGRSPMAARRARHLDGEGGLLRGLGSTAAAATAAAVLDSTERAATIMARSIGGPAESTAARLADQLSARMAGAGLIPASVAGLEALEEKLKAPFVSDAMSAAADRMQAAIAPLVADHGGVGVLANLAGEDDGLAAVTTFDLGDLHLGLDARWEREERVEAATVDTNERISQLVDLVASLGAFATDAARRQEEDALRQAAQRERDEATQARRHRQVLVAAWVAASVGVVGIATQAAMLLG